jgi:hypothetical protein
MYFLNTNVASITSTSSDEQLDLGCFWEITEMGSLAFLATTCEGMNVKFGSANRIVEILKRLSSGLFKGNLGEGRKNLGKHIAASLKSIPSKSALVVPRLNPSLMERGTNVR